MAAFQKLGDYTNGTVNDGSEVTTEFNNIYEAFNGVSSDKEMERKLSHATKAPMIMNQTGAGDLADYQKAGVSKIKINNQAELVISNDSPVLRMSDTTDSSSIRFDMVGNDTFRLVNEDLPDVVFSVDLPTNVLGFVNQPNFPDNEISITKSWLYSVLPAAVEGTQSQPSFIVPSIGQNKITKIYSTWAAGADSLASNIFTIKRRNAAGALQADIGTIDVNNGAQNVLNTNDIGDVTLTAGDQIYPLFTTRNTASEQLVTISIEIAVKLS